MVEASRRDHRYLLWVPMQEFATVTKCGGLLLGKAVSGCVGLKWDRDGDYSIANNGLTNASVRLSSLLVPAKRFSVQWPLEFLEMFGPPQRYNWFLVPCKDNADAPQTQSANGR